MKTWKICFPVCFMCTGWHWGLGSLFSENKYIKRILETQIIIFGNLALRNYL